MSLTVGVDSYVTAEDATAYIHAHFLSADDARVKWDALPDEDKEVILRRAAGRLERLAFRGVKANQNQPLSFLRCFSRHGWSRPDGAVVCRDESHDIPAEIIAAQVQEAAEIVSPGRGSEAKENRQAGVKSVTFDDYAVAYADTTGGALGEVLASPAAQGLVSRYTGGVFCVR